MPARATSLAARSSRRPAHTQRRRVFLFILNRGPLGATLEEIEVALDLSGNTIRPRRVELEAKGFVEDSGRTRKTTSGREAIVWVTPALIALRAAIKLKAKGYATP
jgi:predicted transcriptional regulator